MLKVLIVVKTLELGGVSNVIFSYFNELIGKEKNICIDFACGVPIEEHYYRKIKEVGSKLYITKKDAGIVKYICRIACVVNSGKYDVVHVHGSSVLIFPDIFGAKLGGARTCIAHCHSTSSNNVRLCKIVKPVFNFLKFKRIACSSEAGCWMFGKKPFLIVHNGILLEEYKFNSDSREKYRKKLNITNQFLIGHVGVFNENKNQSFIVNIFKQVQLIIPNAKLLLIGEGELKKTVIKKTCENGLQDSIFFLENNDDISEWLMAMDTFLMPSIFEGLPRILVEAQAVGLPCVVSDNISLEAKLSDIYYTCSLNNPEQWLSAIVKCHEMIEDRLSDACIAHEKLKVHGYDIEKEARKLLSLYLS